MTTRSDLVIERCTLKNLHVNKNPEQLISEYNECHVPGYSFFIEPLSCDSPHGCLRTIIIVLFAVSTTCAPDSCQMHTPHTIWDNFYQPWAIEAYFCFYSLFITVKTWHYIFCTPSEIMLPWRYSFMTRFRMIWIWG